MSTFPETSSSQAPETLDYLVPKLDQSDFDKLIKDHGYRVIREKGIKCPCTSRNAQYALVTCKNCGGRGWFYLPDIEENIIVLQSMNRNSKYETWTEANSGTVQITARWKNRLTVNDRITLIDSTDIYTENLNFYEVKNKIVAQTIYNIKDVEYLLLYKGDDKDLQELKKDVDYTVSLNTITLKGSIFRDISSPASLGISIRYTHSPQYVVIDVSRNIMENSRLTCGSELEDQNFPIKCIGRISHYVLNLGN